MPGFLYQMLKHRNDKTYLVGKLIESGRLTPANFAVKRNLGKRLENFKRRKFYKLAQKISFDGQTSGGLYMPLLINRNSFLKYGGYPQGNITRASFEQYLSGGNAVIASRGEDLFSGDYAFVKRLEKYGWDFKTVNNAVLYHFQEGEKSEYSSDPESSPESGIHVGEDEHYDLLHLASKSSVHSTGNPRLIVTSSIASEFEEKYVVLITDDLESVQDLESGQMNRIKACITANESVLQKLAIENDIHAYYLGKIAGFSLEERLFLVSGILKNELRYTFLPQEPKSARSIVANLLPVRLRMLIRSLIK
jgi:hypothetical protein